MKTVIKCLFLSTVCVVMFSCEDRIGNFPQKTYYGSGLAYELQPPFTGLHGSVGSYAKYCYSSSGEEYPTLLKGKINYIDRYNEKWVYRFENDGTCSYRCYSVKNQSREVFDKMIFDDKGRLVSEQSTRSYDISTKTLEYDDESGVVNITKQSRSSENSTPTTEVVTKYLPKCETILTGWKTTKFSSDKSVSSIEYYNRRGEIVKTIIYDEYGNEDKVFKHKYKRSDDNGLQKIIETCYVDGDFKYKKTTWTDNDNGVVVKCVEIGHDKHPYHIKEKYYEREEYDDGEFYEDELDEYGNPIKRTYNNEEIQPATTIDNYYDNYGNLVIKVETTPTKNRKRNNVKITLWKIEYLNSDYTYDHKKEHPELFVEHNYNYNSGIPYSGYYPGYSYDYQPFASDFSGEYEPSNNNNTKYCRACNNTGDCPYCNGTGNGRTGGMGINTLDSSKDCTHCGGSGKCPVCGGR